MYASIRDAIALQGWPTIREALNALSMDAVELEVSRDMSVHLVEPDGGQTHATLDSQAAIEAFAEHLGQHSTRASAFLLHNDFNRDDVEAEVNWVISVVNAAAALAIPAIRIDAVMTGEKELPLDQRVQRFAECMRRVLDSTDYHIVELGIENHGFQGNTPEFLDNVLNAVDSPRLGLTLDTGNFYWWGHPLDKVYEIIEHFAARTKHTHAKNIAYPAELQQTQREMGWGYGEYVCPLPDGDIDHFKVVRILKSAGYAGDLCLEDESLGRFPEAEWREVLRRDADHLRGVIEAE
ncbi:MAG: TIM barrel protein [Armatimonadetes bacterium]|nr:TIM barrel protein [Armatimonadota bacterium]